MVRFRAMNPFHFVPEWRIPVPGLDDYAQSLESVWQALKLVDGHTDLPMLHTPPVKRPPDQERGPGYDYAASVFRFGDHMLDLVTARYLIYLPTYLYLLDRLVPESVVEEILGTLAGGGGVVFYDWDANHDIEDTNGSFSHSAILSSWFGGTLHPDILDRRERWLARHQDRWRPEMVTALPLARYQQSHGL
ncbi:hypothetical protein ABZT02_40670 [Streptomyces sp. NPDC005402]|uniref:DUF6939 family protein n=1 Tax=Streptomyces sp. NPDC005402 TaxID=3155338 RepID=UPI0033B27C33